MKHLDLWLPAIILFLAFSLKFCINRSLKIPDLVKAIYELPVDIVFLAISFLAAHAISLTTSKADALILCIGLIAFSIVNILLWTISTNLFYKKYTKWSIALTSLNYFTTISILILVINNFLTLKQ